MAAVGVFRVIKACKFLPEFGWQPIVLTVKDGFNYAYDHSLLERLPHDLRVVRSKQISPLLWWDRRTVQNTAVPRKSMEPPAGSAGPSPPKAVAKFKKFLRNLMSLPDSDNFWIPFAVAKGLSTVYREKIDVIMTTSPPASAHLIGCNLSWLTGRPLVVDYRDLWTQNEGYHLRKFSPMLRRIDRWMERSVLKRAKAVVTATDEFSELLRKKQPVHRPGERSYDYERH